MRILALIETLEAKHPELLKDGDWHKLQTEALEMRVQQARAKRHAQTLLSAIAGWRCHTSTRIREFLEAL